MRTNTLAERGVIQIVYQFGDRVEMINVWISVNFGVRKFWICFILDLRITLDSRIINRNSRIVMQYNLL